MSKFNLTMDSNDNTEEVVNQLIERNSGKTIIYLKMNKLVEPVLAVIDVSNIRKVICYRFDDDDEFTPERIKAFIDFAICENK